MLIYDSDLFGQMAIVFIVYLAIVFIIALATYIINALFLVKVGKDVDASSLWMAWIPVVNAYYTGKLARRTTEDDSFFKTFKISFFLLVLISVLIVPISLILENLAYNAMSASMMLTMMVFLAIASVFFAVMYYMALYRILIFYEPEKGTLYLILMILFPIAQPILFAIMMSRTVGKGYVKPPKPKISDDFKGYNGY